MRIILLIHIVRRTPEEFTFTQCGIIGGGKKKGDAPWLLLAGGVNSNTPSVDSPSNGSGSSGGGSGGSALVPVVGMYFLHPDHLGSITMITDGRGNVIAGGNNGGKSHISYTPYGGIHRTDSSGPDITRFKYTGQEEDKESGLMYYKARYYDPMIGRFLQADSVVMPQSTFGMNRYMYVEGNPVRFGDDSGNIHHNGKQEKQINSLVAAVVLARDPRFDLLQATVLGITVAGGNKYHISEDLDLGNIGKSGRGENWLRWVSGGLQRAGDTVNLYTGRSHHKPGEHGYERSDLGRSDLGKSDLKRFYKGIFDHVDLGINLLKGDRDAVTKIMNRNDIVRGVTRNRACVKLGVNIALLAFSIFTFNWEATPGYASEIINAGDKAHSIYNIGKNTQNIYNAYQIFSIVKGANDTASSRNCDFKDF